MGSRHGLPSPLPLALGLLVDVEPGFVLVPYVAAEFWWVVVAVGSLHVPLV